MTYLVNMDLSKVAARNLSDPVKAKLTAWRKGITEPTADTRYGLWIYGARRSGTSYVGKVLAAHMAFRYGFEGAERVMAVDLLHDLRAVWTAGQVMRTNSDDVGLYWEATNAEEKLQHYFDETDLLWVDDFHHESIDMPMWKKHIQPLIEVRVKDERPTIVCSTLDPNSKALSQGIVDGLFLPLSCKGYRPEATHAAR